MIFVVATFVGLASATVFTHSNASLPSAQCMKDPGNIITVCIPYINNLLLSMESRTIQAGSVKRFQTTEQAQYKDIDPPSHHTKHHGAYSTNQEPTHESGLPC